MGVAPEFLFVWVLERAASGLISNDLNEALVAIRNQPNNKYGRQNCVDCFFYWNIFGIRFPTQFLWYARPYYVGVEAQLLYLLVPEGALLPFLCSITCQTWPLMIWAKHCSYYTTNLSNKNGWKTALFFLKYFRHSFFDAIIMVCPVIICRIEADFLFVWLSGSALLSSPRAITCQKRPLKI